MNNVYDFAVIGGDLRQVYLVEELYSCRKKVCHYALYAAACADCADSLTEACADSACIVGPVPLSKNGLELNQSGVDEAIPLSLLLSCLHPGQFFFAGCIPQDFRNTAEDMGVHVFDLMENPSLTCFNTIATAEGAICEAISRSPLNLRYSSCAVLGFGNCGRTISYYLKGMLCQLQVISNDPMELAQAALIADRASDICDFHTRAGEFDFIFNTIPAVTITADLLLRLKPSVTIIDIASSPGGVDFSAAQELNINAVQCPGLPGRYAPASSARGILETIGHILNQSFS